MMMMAQTFQSVGLRQFFYGLCQYMSRLYIAQFSFVVSIYIMCKDSKKVKKTKRKVEVFTRIILKNFSTKDGHLFLPLFMVAILWTNETKCGAIFS